MDQGFTWRLKGVVLLQPPEPPAEVKALAQSTVMGGFLGMAYGGMKEHRLNAARGLPSPPPGLPSKAHEAKWLAEANTARLLGTLRAAARHASNAFRLDSSNRNALLVVQWAYLSCAVIFAEQHVQQHLVKRYTPLL